MRGAGLERVGGGEVTAFGFQVGTHLNANTGSESVKGLQRHYVNTGQ